MAENPVVRRNEEETNRLMARVMLYCLPFFPLIIFLRLLGLFSTPISQYLLPFGLAVVFLLLPYLLLSQGIGGPWFKYVILAGALGAVTALYVNYWEIGRFIEWLWLFPAVVASAYVAPDLIIYSTLASLVLMDLFYGLALTTRPLYITEYVTTYNLFADLILRDINLIAVTLALYGLNLRLGHLISNLVSGEEQAVLLSRLTKIMHEATRAAKNLVGTAEQITQITEDSVALGQQASRLSREMVAEAEEDLPRFRRWVATCQEVIRELAASAAEIQAVATSLEEFGSSGRQGAFSVEDELAATAQIVEESKSLLARLGERTEDITRVVGLITSIARQTKLLAVNASIEAARAGEGGRGFQAVALSIRDLAARSTQAAEAITALMGELQEHIMKQATVIGQKAEHIARALSGLGEVGASLARMAGTEESLRQKLDRLAHGLERLAKTLENMMPLGQGIEEGRSREYEKAKELVGLTAEQESKYRAIREVAGGLRETAEALRGLTVTGERGADRD